MELYPKYEVSTEGRIRNSITHHIYSQRLRKDGYLDFDMIINGKRKKMLVHRLVAMCYLNNPYNLPEVNHKNKIKTDNRPENLEWVTRQQNTNHRNQDIKTQQKMQERGKQLGDLNHRTKGISVMQYDLNNNLIEIFPSLISAEKKVGINRKYIRACIKGQRNTAGGYIWKLYEGSTTIPGGSRV